MQTSKTPKYHQESAQFVSVFFSLVFFSSENRCITCVDLPRIVPVINNCDQSGWPNELNVHLPLRDIRRFRPIGFNPDRVNAMA